MANYRSEGNKFPNKENYKDLNLSLWPNTVDTRENNINMKGFTNIGEGKVPDYVMAEYVNSLIDAVMGIQRSLGTTPMVYESAENVKELIESYTVGKRLSRIESGLFDERYGGKGWTYTDTRPTLNNHSHTGTNGQPPKINLKNEVTSTLNKANINLTQTASGLLATDILMSTTDGNSISKSIEDKLSKSKGGVVQGDSEFKGLMQTTTTKHFNTSNLVLASGKKESDNQTASGYAISATENKDMINQKIDNLEYGYYAVAFRLKANSSLSSNESVTLRVGNIVESLNSNDISTSYKQFFVVLDINSSNKNVTISVIPSLKTSGHTILLDNIVINPTHPAILDR